MRAEAVPRRGGDAGGGEGAARGPAEDVPILVVGGVKPDLMSAWLEAGADGFGLGSGVFKLAAVSRKC